MAYFNMGVISLSVSYYHGLCNRYRGRRVEIRTRDGRTHRGFIREVDNRNVFIEPFDGSRRFGGFGYGFYGGYRPFGFGYGIALGFITGLVLLPFLFI